MDRTKKQTIAAKCQKLPPKEEATVASGARRLNFIVDQNAKEWPINCGEQPQLCEVVKRVHRDRAVMAAVSNRNILGMLGRFVDSVQKAHVPNFLVVALDQATADFLARRNAPHYIRKLRSRSGSTDNHATSGLKFHILKELLSVGVSVLLTDVDVVLTQDPFGALYRDTDVEGMTDGWDDESAYGHVHELPMAKALAPPFSKGGGAWTAGGKMVGVSEATLPPPGYANAPLRSVRMVARNSGLFYLSATHEALKLMEILAARMAAEDVWDQSAYNMEIFRPAYGSFEVAGVSVRSMNYMCFCNTKFVFKVMRYDTELIDTRLHKPVSVHINYHPEKELRMDSVNRFYHQGDAAALDKWNGGEGVRSGGCRGKVGVGTNNMPELTPSDVDKHLLVGNIIRAADAWTWQGAGPIVFERSGLLRSPWGGGSWGTVPSPWRKDSVHVRLPQNGTFLLMFLSEKWSFVAVRCEDEHVSYGALDRTNVPDKRLVF